MDFLVTLLQDWPALREHAALDFLVEAERQVGAELLREGTLVKIWRVPGTRSNVGIWRAADATALHLALGRQPMWPWLSATVMALAEHPLESQRA